MGPYIGDFGLNDTIRRIWTTHLATGGGATRSVNGTLAIYKDGSSTQITAGITDTEDFDTVTGLHLAEINVQTAGLTPGSDYHLVLTGATVDGETGVIAVICSFSILNRGTNVVSRGLLDAADATGFTLPSGQRSNVRAGDIITAFSLAGARLGERSILTYNTGTGVGTVSDWDTTPTGGVSYYAVERMPKVEGIAAADIADGALTAAKFADGFLTAAKIATGAIDADALAADAKTELTSDLATAANLATVAGYLDTEIAAIKAVTDDLAAMLEDDGGTPRFTANALEEGPVGGGTVNANVVSIEATPIADIQAGLGTEAQLDAIEADTQDIQSRIPAALSGGKMPAALDAAGLATDAVSEIVAAVMAYEIETGHPVSRVLKNYASVLLGKTTKSGSTRTYRNLLDTGNQVVATTDTDGQRTAVTLGS